MTNLMQQTVVIADYDYGDVDIERAIIEAAGLRLVAAQCKTEDDVIEAARDADAIIAQYATVGARAIDAFTRCRVIARYGTEGEIPAALTDREAQQTRGVGGTRARATSWASGVSSGSGGASWDSGAEAPVAYRMGEDVFHPSFGEGVVTATEPGGIVVIRFSRDGSERKLVADLAPISKR